MSYESRMGFQEICPSDPESDDPLISERMTSPLINQNPPHGKKPTKVPYSIIRIAWDEARRDEPKITKAELARRLGLNVSTVRGVLNRHKSYRDRERRNLAETGKQTLIFAW